MRDGPRSSSFYALAAVFVLFVAFLYGPLMAIVLLSFQGPDGGLTFPMIGWSTHWFAALFEQQRVGDFKGSFLRSLGLGLIVMALTVEDAHERLARSRAALAPGAHRQGRRPGGHRAIVASVRPEAHTRGATGRGLGSASTGQEWRMVPESLTMSRGEIVRPSVWCGCLLARSPGRRVDHPAGAAHPPSPRTALQPAGDVEARSPDVG